MKTVIVGKDKQVTHAQIGGGQEFVLIAGPCVIESREHAFKHAEQILKITQQAGVKLIYKSSYDKANRTSSKSFRGLGLDQGLEILAALRREFAVPIITDVHSPEEVQAAAKVVDLLQIPAFLCRQTDLLAAAGRSALPVMVKKGQFLSPDDMPFVIDKIKATGNKQVICCERGTSFGYRDLIVDMRGLQTMRSFGSPVVLDASHSVQRLGGVNGVSGGDRTQIPALARAGVAVGIDALFIECHENPDKALSDSMSQFPLNKLPALLDELLPIWKLRQDSLKE
ncbi:3-deoxy-8-phosphooctulonate synthase [bacterium]|nr:3-deoxy-8-phosphooctulonate synthase [bacterium]